MASTDDAHSQPQRPAAMAQQPSSQSHRSQSPDSHQRPVHHKVQRHVVGQRVQRNTSIGKNLNKLNKAAKEAQQATENSERHHRRTQSGNSIPAPSSLRPGFKRNPSSGTIVKASQTQVNLRKNYSSGHLARQGHTKVAFRSSKSDVALKRRSLQGRSRSQQSSPEPHTSVHFDVDSDGEGGDDGWTEESASQSPTTTRSNTRSNSVVLDAQHKTVPENMESKMDEVVQGVAGRDLSSQNIQTLADRTRDNTRANGGNDPHHSQTPDAEVLTSRLLQRSSSHLMYSQPSSGATTAVATNRKHLLGNSAASTLINSPGQELVSRFIDGQGSAGTPQDGNLIMSQDMVNGEAKHIDATKRNKSLPNVCDVDARSKTPQRSGANTPTNLPLSRTQQKLILQRASSSIEPQKMVPVMLPRSGGPTLLSSSIHYHADSEGRLDPRLQQQFNHVTVEYNVVRRYRNPLGDGIGRIMQIPSVAQKARAAKAAGLATNGAAMKAHGTSSMNASLSDASLDGSPKRSRVSLEKDTEHGRKRGEAREWGRSMDKEGWRGQNEAEEICRRMWESAEVVEAD